MNLLPTYAFGDKRLERWVNRRPKYDPQLVSTVASIFAEVEREGLEAVARQTRRFDAPELNSVIVTEEELRSASIAPQFFEAIQTSIERVRDFHEVQLSTLTEGWDELDLGWGWRMDAIEDAEDTGYEGQRMLPLSSVGVYVPGGKGTYPSSVIMNVLPAKVAGVERVIVATPPRADGTIDPAVLVACRELEIDLVIKAGGASAVAVMALGCAEFARVDKVVGPGNSYVNEAKRQLWGSVGLDSYAGPSEVAVYADGACSPEASAVDLLTQVEHAEDNVGVLICRGQHAADSVMAAVEQLLNGAEREQIMRSALRDHGVCVVVESDEQAIEIINAYAPEHLSIHCADAGKVAQGVLNCGCILIGPNTPQSAGDFVSGPSHTLPTAGSGRFGSPVNVMDFLKVQSVSMLTQSDLAELSPVIERFGEMEGFPMHARGGTLRLE